MKVAEMTEEPKVPEKLSRPNHEGMDLILGEAMPALDYGFVRVIDYMGDENAIVQAAAVSYGKGTKSTSDSNSLIRYLMRHRHSTPFEMCEIKLHVKLPIFVARQWIRHRTANVNEYSARYSILSREFYVPKIEDIAKQSKTNKQGRDAAFDESEARDIRATLQVSASRAFDIYDALICEDVDLARELARINLPLSAYTEWYWKIDGHNLLHFLSLRADPHAQKEIREYAEIICGIVEMWMPKVYEAFLDYRVNAHTFSGKEMAILRKMVMPDFGGFVEDSMVEGISKREMLEFQKVLGVL